jgi:hydrogenase maturation protease
LLRQVEGKANRLIIGIGNPSRGDDALGSLAIEHLEALELADVELLTDFQLQVEYVLDMEGREEVIFIDATVEVGVSTFAFQPVLPAMDTSYSTHELSPRAVLAAYERHYDRSPPPSFALAIRGHDFELGEGLSAPAASNLDAALDFLTARLSPGRE